jgi:hypothetical protein
MATSSKVYFKLPSSSITPKSEFIVDVLLDTDTSINAVDLQIFYSSDKLKFLGFNNTGSIVDIWQGGPTLLRSGHIELTGGVLKSFSGIGGKIISMSFRANDIGEVKLFFERNNLYLANGQGTKILADISSLAMTIVENGIKTVLPENKTIDFTPPGIFLNISKDPIQGNSLIIFEATDKESGIKIVEMRVKKWFSWGDWEIVENPVLYSSGVWQIELRATNNSNLTITKSLTLSNVLFKKLSFVVLVFIFVLLVLTVYNKYRREH